jgi:hypothetical protein
MVIKEEDQTICHSQFDEVTEYILLPEVQVNVITDDLGTAGFLQFVPFV